MGRIDRRLGSVLVPYNNIDLFHNVIATGGIILRSEFLIYMDAIQYVLNHPSFEEVPEGKHPPEYIFQIRIFEGNRDYGLYIKEPSFVKVDYTSTKAL